MSHIAVHVDYTSLLKKLNEKGITGYTLSKKYQISHKTLYNVKHGKMITLETLAKLSYILECNNIGDLVQFNYTITEEE